MIKGEFMDNLQLFGKRIQELRKAKSLTQEKLAEIIGLDSKQISNLETGNCFTTMATLEKLAEIFECEIYQLFNFSHLKSKKEIIPDITKKLNSANEKEIKLISKIINGIMD